MLGESNPNLGPWSCMSSNYVPSTMLEPSMHYLTQCSHSILSGGFCYLCFTDEGTKALRGGKFHLGSCLKHYTGMIPFLLTTPLTDSEKRPGVVNLA